MTRFCLLMFIWGTALCGLAFGQREAILPLTGNPALKKYQQRESERLAKAGNIQPRAFPITEHFIANSPDTLFWVDNKVSVSQRMAVFNAQNATGGTYNNNDSSKTVIDQLTSKSLNFIDLPDRCYLSFDYETGNTWNAEDSLTVEALNAAGFWDIIWTSIPLAVTRRNITLNFPLGLLYKHATFQLRFSSYSRAHQSNTQTFKLYNCVFALKSELPFYENIFWDSTHTYRKNWSKMQASVKNGYDIKWGNLLGLDVFDEKGTVYNNGFNDSIQSHSFDFSGFSPNDSVFFRFYYRPITNVATDSLIIQFKNNAGLWVDQLAVSASIGSGWRTFSNNVNRSRFNHDNFQYRIIARSNNNVSDTLKWLVTGFHVSKKLLLPFTEDFSSTTDYPNQNKWTDKLVFVNHNYAIAPPSINVATFDGLNRVGIPYGAGRGYCDTLTSLPIKLDKLTDADTSGIYLTFYIQPQGLGEPLTNGDSLMLFARFSQASPDSFNLLWRTGPAGLRTDTFIRITILLPRMYWHDDFQLRFVNIGSKTGNLAHWHLDYIYLDRGRSVNDDFLDVAIRDYPSPLLRKYSSVPYTHFKQNQSLFLSDTQYVAVNNNSNQAYAVNYGREVFDQEYTRVDSFGNVFNNFAPLSTQTGGIKRSINFANLFNTDSSVIHSRFYTKIGTTNDNIRSNDTVWQDTYLGNYYAYDDGTAEAGYAILESTGKVALEYEFSQPDSLYGISIFYNRGVTDISQLSFDLKVWQSISPEVELLSIPAKAIYYNARNGFHYVKFDNPIYVNDKVFIGWNQNQVFPLNVGLDVNHKVNHQYIPNPAMSYYVNGVWRPTAIAGALMMRAIAGKWVDPPPVGLNETKITVLNAIVYPNPSGGIINIRTDNPEATSIEIFDLSGKLILNKENITEAINLEQVSNGIYFVKLKDNKTAESCTSKLVISH